METIEQLARLGAAIRVKCAKCRKTSRIPAASDRLSGQRQRQATVGDVKWRCACGSAEVELLVVRPNLGFKDEQADPTGLLWGETVAVIANTLEVADRANVREAKAVANMLIRSLLASGLVVSLRPQADIRR